MNIVPTPLPGVLLITPRTWLDDRGAFHESWHAARYAAAGIPGPFVQDNVSHSKRGVIRGLHFQQPGSQGKLVFVTYGSAFDVVVDVRAGSPTFGRWFSRTMAAASAEQLYVPPGCAHGFQALSDITVFAYKCDAYYAPANERTIRWDDSQLGITWPLPIPTLSDKDGAGDSLAELLARGELPVFRE